MFINMVPGHPFNEMKPNSGGSELEPADPLQKFANSHRMQPKSPAIRHLREDDPTSITVLPQLRHQADARASSSRHGVRRNDRPRPWRAGPPKTRGRPNQA